MSISRNIVVTGTNRGIGQAIASILLSQPHLCPLTLWATTRRGDDLELRAPHSGRVHIRYPSLDIADPQSVRGFADHIRRNADNSQVDVLINNAGVNLDDQYGPRNAEKTLDVNYRGTLNMCRTFIPLLTPGTGRIVNVSSVASKLVPYSAAVQSRFRGPDLSFEGLESLAQEFQTSVRNKTESADGFVAPGRSYNFSKACVNALTRILARQNPGLIVNACCPGWVKTDMGVMVGRPPKTPEEGAQIPVRLAVGDIGEVTGAYWANPSVRSREAGQVQEW